MAAGSPTVNSMMPSGWPTLQSQARRRPPSKNTRHELRRLFRQSVFGQLAGYDNT
jgi:hypothetical protein